MLELGNEDRVPHSTRTYALKNPAIGSLSVRGYKMQLMYKKAESFPFKVGCDFHSSMIGYWLIIDHPYAALTDANGQFHIDNLPVGNHEFRIWHERVGPLNQAYKVTVTAGDPVELPVLKLMADRFESKSP